ncbi:zinc finger protein ZFP2-like isoform X3 [Eurosta solidaginis]|uniref:zinc finger protein ZFP2-like isoform X3 n=1 Tax=Eurosta solidaginis TaxID=178769 RepID=UPI003530DF21
MDTSDLYIDYLCRTCMIKPEAFASEGSTEPQHQSIFETIYECDELRIADLLSSTIPQIVEVQLSDELPKKICCKCLHQLIIVYRFQKMCLQSDHKMREIVCKKLDDLNMSMMEAEIDNEVLPNHIDSCPLSSCQPKCTAQNSLLPETETALEGRHEAIESESAQWSTAEHLLKNDQLLDFRENSQGKLSEFIKNDPIEDEENTEYSDTIQAKGELSEFIKNEPIEDDDENTEYSDTIHSTTFVTKEEFTTEEQKITVPCKENLEEGKQLKHQGNELECDICGKCFYRKSYLRQHKRTHSGEKPYKCDICERRFANLSHVSVHMRTHTGEKPYKCKYCESVFVQLNVLHRHLRMHLGVNIHRCKFCPLAFPLASELRLHLACHKNEEPETRERNITALKEEAKLKQKLLEIRYKNIRKKNQQYPCDICGKHFKTNWVLKIHKRNHSGEKPHKCDFCEMRHINIGNKNEQYPCDICGKHFKTKSRLNIHKLIHSDEKPHKCELCEKRFSRATTLSHHMRTHTGEKPYKCKYCDRCFTTKHHMNKHLRIHIGHNIYRCESCPLAFRFATDLRLHSTTHKDEDPETRERNMKALMEIEAKLKQQALMEIEAKLKQKALKR